MEFSQNDADLSYDILQFQIESVNTYFGERQENMIDYRLQARCQ